MKNNIATTQLIVLLIIALFTKSAKAVPPAGFHYKQLISSGSYANYTSPGNQVLILNTISCVVSPLLDCDYTINEYTLEVEVKLNDVNGQHVSDLSATYNPTTTFTITPTIYNVCGFNNNLYYFETFPDQAGTQTNIPVTLNKNNPTLTYKLDINATTKESANLLTLESLLTASPSSYGIRFPITNFTSSQVDFNNLILTYRIVPKRYVGIYNYIMNPIYSAVQNGTTKKVDFHMGDCDLPPLYQLQVIRLYNEKTNQPLETDIYVNSASVDWSKALNIYTANKDISLTLAEGTGYYAWRFRTIVPRTSSSEIDPNNWDDWQQPSQFLINNPPAMYQINGAQPFIFYFNQFDNDKNWYYSRNMIEGDANMEMKQNIIGEGMTFANGLGMIRQNQFFSNTNNEISASNEMQDFVGRTALKTLIATVPNQSYLGYVQGFTGTYSVNDFDMGSNFNNPAPMVSSIITNYYSNNNIDKDIPNADQFPFTRTLFGRNSQNEIVETSMPGDAHKIQNPSVTPSNLIHTNRTFIASAADIELVRIFGDEAPPENTVLKKISIDPNNEKSITYVDKTGKTLATCLSVKPSELLEPLASAATAEFEIIHTINVNEEKGDYITASKSLVFEEPNIPLNISYQLNEKKYQDLCASLCSTCDYKVNFSLINQDEPDIILWEGESIINPATLPCSSLTAILHNVPIYHVGTMNPWPAIGTYTIQSAGKYLMTKKVSLYNKPTGGNITYLDLNASNLESQLTAIYEDSNFSNKYWEVWDGISNTPLTNGLGNIKINLKEFKEKLFLKQMKGPGGVYELMLVNPSSEDVYKRILKFNDPLKPDCNTQIAFDIQACNEFDCSNLDAFTDQLLALFNEQLLTPNISYSTLSNFNGIDDIFRINSCLIDVNQIYGAFPPPQTSPLTGNNYIPIGQAGITRIIKNMLTDTDECIADDKPMMYTCDEITKAWNHACKQLFEFYSPDAIQFRLDNNLVMEPDFVDYFLEAAGYKFTCGTKEPGDVNTPNSLGFATTPYRCFKYFPDLTEAHNFATPIINSATQHPFVGAAAVILYFNNHYNSNLPTGCINIFTPTNDYNNPTSTQDYLCFDPNLAYFINNTPLTSGACHPEIPLDMLVMAYKSLKDASNASAQAGGFVNIPDPTDQTAMEQVALKMEYDCINKCNERWNEVTVAVNEEFLLTGYDGIVSVEGYKSGHFSETEYWSTNFPISHRDVFVSGIIENCKSKCKVDLVPFTANGGTIYKFDEADMKEYMKAMTWEVAPVIKPISHAQVNCASCMDLEAGNPVTITPSATCANPLNNLGLIYENTSDFDFQMFGGAYYGCCKNAFAHYDTIKYPLENADPRIPKEFAQVYILNSDFHKSAFETMIKFLNKRVTNQIINGATSYNIYEDILNYQSPIQYQGTGFAYNPLIRNSNGGYQIAVNGVNPNDDIFDVNLGANPKNAHFSIGEPLKATISAGPNYIIERETRDVLPFHAHMPVKIKISRSPSAPAIFTPELVEFEEFLKDYSFIDSDAPVLAFDAELSSLKFSKEFKNPDDVLEFEFTVKVHHDYNNATNETQKLRNEDIDIANSTNALFLSSCLLNNSWADGKPVIYSSSSLTVAGNTQSFNNPTNCTGGAISSNDNIVFIPYLHNYAVSPNHLQTPNGMPLSDVTLMGADYTQTWNLSTPPTISGTVTLSSNGGLRNNYNVQVAPLYYNYTDAGGIEHHDFLMDLSAFKTFWHNYFCVQWHPPIYNDVELDPETPIGCADAEALEILDAINSNLNTLKQNRVTQLKNEYKNNCAKAESLNDALQVAYKVGYHNYTLYYYDRAGNLVRTVPPEGVEITATNRSTHPNHRLVTEYNYNSLNQITSQYSPDGGNTVFWYDKLGRIRFSQNAKQAAAINLYSFTNYDNLGRITSVGQINTTIASINANIDNSTWPTTGTITDLVNTYYNLQCSLVVNNPVKYCNTNSTQRNLLNRVSYTIADADGNLGTANDKTTTFYSYDVHGNVEWMGTKIADMPSSFVRYEYDLISGSVVKVVANECDRDALFHKYVYNTDKKLQKVFTSRDGTYWDNDATYTYYKHGPLRNVVVGHDKIQQVDYGYTIMGWLKGINHLSKDNAATTAPSISPLGVPDLYATKLHYFNGDFNRSYAGITSAYNTTNGPSGSTNYNTTNSMDNIFGGASQKGGLYNGNIRGIFTAMTNPVNINITSNNIDQLYAHIYKYDELNRLTQTAYYSAFTPGNLQLSDMGNAYKEQFTYDANGNIKTAKRYDGDGMLFDDFGYDYPLATGKLISNRLNRVTDAGTSTATMTADYDIKPGQAGTTILNNTSNNYQYDALGNLIEDKQEKLTITWNNFGKIAEINKESKTKIQYFYDAAGNRVAKSTFTRLLPTDPYPSMPQKQEYYIRDASGNIMSNYARTNVQVGATWTSNIIISDQPIYGSDRLGVFKNNIASKYNGNTSGLASYSYPIANTLRNERQKVYRSINLKRYELKDHLGNVRTNFSDMLLKAGGTLVCGAPNTSCTFGITGLKAYQTSLYNYYAFGMPKPIDYSGALVAMTNWYDEPNNEYRFGWNSAEKLKEISGAGNTLDLGERFFNARLGKMFSTDPLETKYPWQSTYAYFKNSPIAKIDWKGCGEGDDWIKNNTTGEYTWDNNVTSSANTPAGSTYVGREDESIVDDMFEQDKYTDKAHELVTVSTEDFENPYQAQGYATIHANVFSDMTVLINPMVTTTYNSNGGVNTKTFDGLKMDIYASSYIAPSGPDLNYVQPVLTVNSKNFSQTLVNLSAERTMKINGQEFKYTPATISDASRPVNYQLNSTIHFKSSELLKHKNSNLSFNFKFSADLWSGNKPLTIPTVLGSISGVSNTVRMGINFNSRR